MKNKTVDTLLLMILILEILSFGTLTRTAKASGTIYIWPDGSIEPPTAPIQRVGNVYTFTADIYDSIEVKAFNIIIDGNNFKLQGPGTGTGFNMLGSGGVTIQNTVITGWDIGISFDSVLGGAAENNSITNNGCGVNLAWYRDVSLSENVLTNNGWAINYLYFSGADITNNIITNNYMGIGGHGLSDSIVTGNSISHNTCIGVLLYDASYSNVSCNSVEHNRVGFFLSAELSASNNRVFDNIVAYNDYGLEIGPYLYGVPQLVGSNFIYHNNFLSNAQANAIVNGTSQTNYWDNGYPSGGNFWSDYNGVDLYDGPGQNITGSDGIGDTPYVIAQENVDKYPLMTPYATTEFFVLRITTTTGGTTDPAPGPYVYTPGTVVDVTAVPEPDFIFDYWELDNVNIGATNPISVTMDTNHALHAVFRPRPDIAVTSVMPYPTSVRRGQLVYIDVTVANKRFTSETFDVIVYADKDRGIIGDEVIIGVQTVYNLLPDGTKTITFIWDTSTLPSGTGYYISAEAIVPYDIDQSNNLLTAKKKVTVRR